MSITVAARRAQVAAAGAEAGLEFEFDRIATMLPARDGLELRVMERTAELAAANQRLQQEIQERRVAEEQGLDVVGEAGNGWNILSDVVDRGKVMLAGEMMGGAQKVLEMTVDYAKVRVQFGRPIGSFQAVQHKCANMMIDVEGAKSAAYYASWAVSNEVSEAPLAAALAKAAASDAFRRVSAEGIQLHGGIGFTWDHNMHLYFKRAKSSEFTFGDANWNRELVANGINL